MSENNRFLRDSADNDIYGVNGVPEYRKYF